MEGWKTDKFKNQIQYKSGYTWSKEQELKTQEPNSVRVLTVTNIQKELDLSEELYLQGVSEKDKKEKAVSKDWCIAVSSNGNRKRIGNAVFIKDDTDCLFASFLTAFKPKDNSDILPDYFFRWLSSHNVQERITSVSEGTTGLGNLDIRYLRNMDIDFPDKSEQTAIAAILSKVDEAIASVQASISAAERLKKSLMQNLLTGRMKPDGTLRKEDEFYVDEKFGRVPVGWEVKKLGQLFSIKAGGDLQEEHYSPIKDATHTYPVFSNSLDNNGLYGYTSNPRFHAKESITITGRGGVGHPEYRQGDYDAIIRLISLIPLQLDTVDCKFVCYYIGRYVHFVLESTGVPQLTCPKVFSTKIMIPIDLKEQCKIGEVIHHFDASIKEKQNKIAVLERLKKSLMQNLLTGRVRIKEQGMMNNSDSK